MSFEFWELLTEVLTVILTASTKFFVSPFLANFYGFEFMEIVIMTVGGGWIGVLFFYFFSDWVIRKTQGRRKRKEQRARDKGKYKPRKKFTRMNKLIIKVKWGFGLIGLAAITPPLASVPLGSVLAAKYFKRNPFTLPALLLSVVLWSFVLTWVAAVLGVEISPDH